jgi:hypothetical protein
MRSGSRCGWSLQWWATVPVVGGAGTTERSTGSGPGDVVVDEFVDAGVDDGV